MNNNVKNGTSKKPFLEAVIFVLIFAVALTAWFVTINLIGIGTTYESTPYLLTHALVVVVSMSIGVILIRKRDWHLAYVGVCRAENTLKSVLYSLPLYAILFSPLLFTEFGEIEFQTATFQAAVSVILFHLTVVLHEEFYFRGIILSLYKNHLKKAVFISAFLFSIMHFLNLFNLAFNDGTVVSGFVVTTLIQVARTFGFGIIFAVIVLKTKSLMPVVLFHWIGNSINRIIIFSGGFVLIQSVLYTIYGVVLLVLLLKKPNSHISD